MSSGLALAVAVAFNLVCSGDITAGDLKPNQALPKTGTFKRVFRIDLSSAKYCSDECEHTSPLEKVSQKAIVFTWSNSLMEYVDRETGEYFFLFRRLPWVYSKNGKCERLPFTGFPALKF